MNIESSLADRWTQSSEIIIEKDKEQNDEGKVKSQYKIDRNKFLGRGGFGVVFVAIRRYRKKVEQKYNFDEVVLKEFKRSDKWKEEEDWDREMVILKKFQQFWKDKYILKVIDIFKATDRKYYLAIKYASGGSMAQRIKQPFKQDQIIQFVTRSMEILRYLHFQLMQDCKSKELKDKNEKMGIIHRDFKPANLVFAQKDKMQSMYLIDFGISKIGYTEQNRPYSNCGTANYKAPQIGQTRIYNAKVDIFSFGCTLFQILSGGERLIGNIAVKMDRSDKEQYVNNKIIDLENRLVRNFQKKQKSKGSDERKIKYPLMWVEVVCKCVQFDPSKRWNSQDLCRYFQKFKNSRQSYPFEASRYFLTAVSQQTRQLRQKRDIYELNFQIHRLSIIQDQIFSIFEFYYFNQPRNLSKFVLYVILKFSCLFIIERYRRIKQRAKLYDRTDKQLLIKRLFEQCKKIQDIKNKANIKINQQRQKQLQAKGQSKGKGFIEDLIYRYPQLIKDSSSEPRRSLYQFCYQVKQELVQNNKFGQMVGCIIMILDDMDAYKQIDVPLAQLMNRQIQAFSLRKLFRFKEDIMQKIAKQKLTPLFLQCQVQRSVRSGLNREEVRTDIPFQRK